MATPRFPGLTATAVITAGTLLSIPSTLGVVLHRQIRRVRQAEFLPRPGYTIDLLVDPPWATGTPLSVAFLGDSLVEGVGAPRPGQSLPAQTAYRLAAHLGRPIRMRGYGIASSRIADVVAEQVPQLDEDVDLVVVLIGANDATHGTPPWDFARQVELLALQAHERTGGAPVVFTGLPELESAPLLVRPLRDLAAIMGDTLHAIQRRLALRLPQARYIDIRCAVGDTVRRRGRELFASDDYHPNPAGYALLGEAIAEALTAVVQDQDGGADVVLTEDALAALHAQAWAEVAALPGVPEPGPADLAPPDLPAASRLGRAA